MRQRYYQRVGLGLAACLLALLQVSATMPAERMDARQVELSPALCEPAAVEFNDAASSLPHDPDAAYFGKRCRLGYPQECLRWCYAVQRINARFYAAQRERDTRCSSPVDDAALDFAATDSTADEVAAITEACATLDLNAIEGILLARPTRGPRPTP